jgi:proteasome lid subunit RPN8/RPN11
MSERSRADHPPIARSDDSRSGERSAVTVSFNRRAHAEMMAHARETLEVEICGVLVGEASRIEEGWLVEVHAAIRGSAAKQARDHVTFTHETWDAIHEKKDKSYPELKIVGWYHTHPGFGVEFSAMDRFIQENFFPAPSQIAILTDPVTGEVAICQNAASGVLYIPEYSVDGRIHRARQPRGEDASAAAAPTPKAEFERLEQRMNHLVAALDDQRRNFSRTLQALVIGVCVVLLGLIGYQVWTLRAAQYTPPRTNSFVHVPVKLGDETVLLGIAIVEWDVPPALDAFHDKVARAAAELGVKEQAARERQLLKMLEGTEKERKGERRR